VRLIPGILASATADDSSRNFSANSFRLIPYTVMPAGRTAHNNLHYLSILADSGWLVKYIIPFPKGLNMKGKHRFYMDAVSKSREDVIRYIRYKGRLSLQNASGAMPLHAIGARDSKKSISALNKWHSAVNFNHGLLGLGS